MGTYSLARFSRGIVPFMLDMKQIALGLAAISGLWGSVAGAKAAVPDDAQPAPLPAPLSGVETSNDVPVVVPAPSEKALRYLHGNNVIWAGEQVLSIALPLLLLFTGLSAWLRTIASQLGGGRFYPTLAIYFVLLWVVQRGAGRDHRRFLSGGALFCPARLEASGVSLRGSRIWR